MKTTLDRYPGYTFIDGKVISPKGNKVKLTKAGYNLVTTRGTKTKVSAESLAKQLGPSLVTVEGTQEIPGSPTYFISKTGIVYSFNPIVSPNGAILSAFIDSKGYLTVAINKVPRRVHTLVALAHLDRDYIHKGLVCMHLDNNKANPILTNLKIGTHSENSQAAHDDGLYTK